MEKNKIKEWSYYLFFGLMVFAKGIGLDSGSKLYYLLSAAACICVGCKLVLTKYNIRQAALMVLLCLTAFISYRNSGRLGTLLTVLALTGLKDMNIKKLFRMGLVIYGCSFAFTVFMAGFGMISNPLDVHIKGGTEVIRWGMGYSTGNIFHVSYFILVVFVCYTLEKRYGIRHLLGLMAGNLLVFLFSLSYTGGIVTSLYLLLNLYAVKRKRMNRAERILCQLPLPLCLLFSFMGPFLLDWPLMQELDIMMQARLSFSSYFLKNQPITLFGARMKDVPYFWVIMDNGYVYIFMTFGIVIFALFCIGYAMLIARYSGMAGSGKGKKQDERLPELAIIFSFLLYGIMEQFISNAFMNLSLLFMGEILFGVCSGEQEDCIQKENFLGTLKKIRFRQWGCCAGIGTAIAVIYLAAVPVKEFVSVPLSSLLYVDAWSAEVQAVNEGNTKERLKEIMEECRLLIEKPEIINEAVRGAGLEGKLTAEEAAAAMEYSLPASVHSSRNYDRFRIRILELYCDITEEEYGRFMAQMTEQLGRQAEQLDDIIYIPKDKAVYPERIEKSSGDDRIEHISKDKGYMVEKNGSIVKLEHFRSGIFYGAAGMAVSMLVCCLGFLGFDKFRKQCMEKRHESSN